MTIFFSIITNTYTIKSKHYKTTLVDWTHPPHHGLSNGTKSMMMRSGHHGLGDLNTRNKQGDSFKIVDPSYGIRKPNTQANYYILGVQVFWPTIPTPLFAILACVLGCLQIYILMLQLLKFPFWLLNLSFKKRLLHALINDLQAFFFENNLCSDKAGRLSMHGVSAPPPSPDK